MRLHLPSEAPRAPDPIGDLLQYSGTIAVVGLSSNPSRPSYVVSSYLQSVGYRIIPVNPNESEVLGEKSYPRLDDIPVPVDIVDVFRRPEHLAPIADAAIRIRAKSLWLQLGIENSSAAAKACEAGLLVVEDACLLIEHKLRHPR